MSNVLKMKNTSNSVKQCNLQIFTNNRMDCPVTQNRICYFIPLNFIDGLSHNPGRAGGTQPTAVSEIFDSLITDPKGQLEPICLEWNPATGKFEIVFGCHREWATNEVYTKGFTIANHLDTNAAGIWAWVFTGSPAERTKIQMRENGNKKPQSPATKNQMVDMLNTYIAQGGLDTGPLSSFTSLSDDDKYTRARNFMKGNTPYWGGRKFKGIWNKLTQNGNPSVAVSFKTYSKSKLADYFCAHNPYGIKKQDLKKDFSGSVVVKNGVKYGIYIVNSKSEIAGALPTNASKCMFKNKVDHMIIVAALNNSTTANISKDRQTFEQTTTEWNQNIYKAFHEVFWMPQTKSETAKHILSGTWPAQNKV